MLSAPSSLFESLDPARKKLAYEKAAERVREIRAYATPALAAINLSIKRKKWREDPVLWAKERLGDTLWSGQVRILHSVRDHRKTAAPTCHEVGKSYGAALTAAWWLDIHAPGEAFVVTTAPTNTQVRVILWKEIGRAHSRGNLRGRVNQTEWKMDVTDPKTGITKEETVAMGRKPNDYSPTSFQGVHAPFVLIIVDEANGVRGLWEALDSVMANDNSKMLAIGNPDDPSGEFFEACKPNSGFNVVSISVFDSPNFTGEPMPQHILAQLVGRKYVEEKRAKWARSWTWTEDGKRCIPPPDGKLEDTHPFWQSKILGQFPIQSSAGSLIPLAWIRSAQERELVPTASSILSLDVGASEAGDPTCCGKRNGEVFRILYEDRQPDTMKSTGRFVQTFSDGANMAVQCKVDYIGVGRGVVDRARELRLPVVAVSVSEMSTIMRCMVCKEEWDNAAFYSTKRQASHEKCPQCGSDLLMKVFANLLAQTWWKVREEFEAGRVDIDPDDEELAEQLLMVRWEPNSKGQIKVSYSDGPSPNRADALMLSYAPEATFAQAEDEFVSW